jgi:quercetin dioxygenase-like cupin family protein
MTGGPQPAGTITPLVSRPADGNQLPWGVASEIAVRLNAQESGGSLGATHFKAAKGEVAGLHRHTLEDELFLVAQGAVEVQANGRFSTLEAGGTVFLPRGSVHGYVVLEPDTQFFVVTTPGGFERFFKMVSLGIYSGGAADRTAEAWSRQRVREIEAGLGTGLEWFE